MIDVASRRALGTTGLLVTPICIGTSALASMPAVYGYGVPQERALATLKAAFSGPFNFMDTSNGYGDGEAERRIGEAIRAEGGLPKGFVLATKVDADRSTRDFSGGRVRRSAEESLKRLGLSKIQLMHLHDPEYYMTFPQAMEKGGPVEALVRLRDEGVADNIGVAAGPVPMLVDFVRTGLFSVVLSHNRYTLLDRSAEPLIEEAGRRGVAYLNAAPYGGGMLAKGPEAQPRYAYRQANETTARAAALVKDVCARHGVSPQAAALQFSLRDPRIASTVVGVTEPSRIEETVRLAAVEIPDALWDELKSVDVTGKTGVA